MGLCPSPYILIQGGLQANRIVTGKRLRKDNAYQQDKLLQNLPFSEYYLADLPKLQKVRDDGKLVSEIVQYVDDNYVVPCSPKQVWLASSQMAKGLCWLGLQDASQKRRRCCQRPGAWAGLVIAAENGKPVTKSVTQERWEKVRNRIR